MYLKLAAYDVTETFAYDILGNLTQKGGKAYVYTGCGNRPHAVCQVGDGALFMYDGNGNMTSGNGRTVEYNPANKPSRIGNDESKATVDFVYGADGHRVVQQVGTNDGEARRTVYVGLGGTGKSIYERTTRVTTGEKEHVQFLYAGGAHGGNAFALRVVTEADSSVAMKYNLFDHLGSVTAMSDEYGQVVGPSSGGADATLLGYDAWDARRNPDASAASTSFNLQAGHREYTGHETIPDVGLVNMNGRVYDPELGRFLTPDPNVQFVADLQSYNRYSYVLNNPLRYTDPTGYGWFDSLLGFAFDLGFALGGAVVCAVSGPGCVGVTLLLTMKATLTMVSNGATLGQIVKADIVGFGAGILGGAIGGAIVGDAGGNLALRILGGAISGGVAAGISTPLLGGDLGRNILVGAATGAATAAAVWAAQNVNPMSKRDVAEQQGGGASGAQKVETLLVGRSKVGGASYDEIDTLVDAALRDYDAGQQLPADPGTEEALSKLNPRAQAVAQQQIDEARALGVDVRVRRTLVSYDEQADVRDEGRARFDDDFPAAAPGSSRHNFGVAWDVLVYDESGHYVANGSDSRYWLVGEIGANSGAEWGATFPRPDIPHFQVTDGIGVPLMRERFEAGLDVYAGR